MNPLPHVLAAASLSQSSEFGAAFARNAAIQLALFTPTSLIPAIITGRMSYVDISWPLGLVFIGLQAPFLPGNPARKLLVSMAYLLQGGRMFSGAVTLWKMGHLNREMTRYVFQRLRWAKRGITESGPGPWYMLTMLYEIAMQASTNSLFLCMPAFLQGSDTSPLLSGGDKLVGVELVGWCCWFASLMFEHTADLQKLAFLRKCKREGRAGTVCNIGLWSMSRHPNYFGEWATWTSLVLASLPSWWRYIQRSNSKKGKEAGASSTISSEGGKQALKVESTVAKAGVTGSLLCVSYLMYVCLTWWTGAIPAEHFSLQKRPSYAVYQQTVSMFFPWFPSASRRLMASS
jgi:steroid 5-alpha reductase family enzyme